MAFVCTPMSLEMNSMLKPFLPACADSRGEIVGKHPVRDPLLDTVHNVELPIGRLRCGRQHAGNVAAGSRLADREADPLVASENFGDDFVPDVRRAEVQHWRQTYAEARPDAVAPAGRAQAAHLFMRDLLVEGVHLFRLHAKTGL